GADGLEQAGWELGLLGSIPGSGRATRRILNGQDAKDGAWPWQVSVRMYGSHICGGSLISESWVVSAAHCFDPRSTPELLASQCQASRPCGALLGTCSLTGYFRIILHPNFNSSTFLADIALVELEKPIAFTAAISPVCLLDASVRVPAGTPCWVTGWGNMWSGMQTPCSGCP
uniref:Peptidase S1 domain-containing protein n=1 Tax=Chelydra serpentina TaxID=8475 RepID=A0A8C3TBN8_CHESE